jgi:Flp pilus assembly protein CpaB
MKWRNILTLTLGLVLALAAGGAVLTILQQVNRPRIPVAIAAVDLAAGQPLRSDSVRYELVDSRSLALKTLLTEAQVQELIGQPLAHPVARSEFISISDIATADSPAAAGRVALMLSDPSLVAVAIPLGEDTAPAAIVVGDSIDISVGLNGTNYARPMDPENATGTGLYASEIQPPDTLSELQATQVAPQGLLLPAAKVIVQSATVLAVQREPVQAQTTTRTTGQTTTAAVPGRIVALTVAVPAEAIELLQFAIDNGIVRIAVLPVSAAQDGPRQPTMGMVWNDWVAFMEQDRQAALGQGPPVVPGPGAAETGTTTTPADVRDSVQTGDQDAP